MVEYFITDLAGNPVASGTLDDAQFFVDANNFAGPEYGFDTACLAAGCYNNHCRWWFLAV